MTSARRPAQPSPSSSQAETPRVRPTARTPQRIQYEAIKLPEDRWGRRLAGAAVVAAVLLGAIGWYHYLRRPAVPVTPTAATVVTPGSRSSPSTSATGSSSPPNIRPDPQPTGSVMSPDNSPSAKPPDDVPRSRPEGVQAPPTD